MKDPCTDESALQRLRAARSEIDGLDERILNLLSRRLAAAEDIGRVKRTLRLEVVDPARERQVLDRLSAKGRGPLRPNAIRTVFSGIIAAARAVQETPRVGYLGPEGTFSHQAALRFYGSEAEYEPLETIEDVFERVARSEVRTGIVPLENSSEGPVRVTLDLFALHDVTIQAEVRLPIRHHLLSRAPDLEAVRRVYSHPMALDQCKRWLREHLPEARSEAVESTARAASIASTDAAAAAVGSRPAGEAAGVPVLKREIQDLENNATRFAVIGTVPLDREPCGRNCTSLLMGLEHRPGALLRAMAPLASHGVNITRIDSRPRRDRAWEYLFFLDLEGHAEDEPIRRALPELAAACATLKILGSYPREDAP